MSLDHLIPDVRRMMSEGHGDRKIGEGLGITRHQARNLMRDVERADGVAAPVVPFAEALQHDPEAWAIRINARWRQSRENIIETGRLLLDAKAACPHGSFENEVMTRLHFSPNVAQRLMAIARDPRLSNPAHVQLLPPSWGTLYELTKLSDEEFDRGVQEQIIRPDMERKEVEILRPIPHRERPETSFDGARPVVPGDVAGDDANGLRTYKGEATDSPSAHRSPPTSTSGSLAADIGTTQSEDRASPALSETPSMPGGGLAIAHNRIEPSDSLDYFPTPPWATRALFEHAFVDLPNPADNCWNVWEPACGEGHMAEVLREYCGDVEATDIFDYGYGGRALDFLSEEASNACPDWIITNPPFGENSIPFVERALDIAQAGVAMFVRLQWLEGVGRYERIFRDRPPTRIAFFAERVPLHKDRWEPEGGTMTAYIWMIWVKDAEPRAPFWIPPGCREALTKPDDAERFTQKPVVRRGNEAAEAAE